MREKRESTASVNARRTVAYVVLILLSDYSS